MIHTTQTLNDPILPNLTTALDCVIMRKRFADEFAPAVRVLDCQIERMKYKPGKNCLLVYRLCLADGQGKEQQREQLICARCYPINESQQRFERARKALFAPTPVGSSLIHLPEIGMVAWLFPNDPKLVGLPKLMDVAQLRSEILPPIVNSLVAADTPQTAWQIAEMTHTLVHYAPEHTCTIRVEIRANWKQQAQRLVLYGKTYANDDGAETARLMDELWDTPTRKTGQLSLAQPLGYDSQHKILWQRGLAGQALLAFEADSVQFESYLQQAAAAVATLHASTPKANRFLSIEQLITKLNEMPTLIAQILPAASFRTEKIIEQLLGQREIVENAPTALLHGDLHLQNFLVDQGEIALIDMDNLVHGSPWQDIGSFIAGLHYRGLLNQRSFAETQQLAECFCAAYERQCNWHYSAAAIDWHTAAALISERAYRTISRWKGGNLSLIDLLLDRAEKITERIGSTGIRGATERIRPPGGGDSGSRNATLVAATSRRSCQPPEIQ